MTAVEGFAVLVILSAVGGFCAMALLNIDISLHNIEKLLREKCND